MALQKVEFSFPDPDSLADGKDVKETENGVPRFIAPESGDFVIFHDATSRRGWISLQIISFVSLIVLALPARRRRREMREEELA